MPPRRTRAALLALLLPASVTHGCAVGNGERRLLLNYLDDRWTPSSETGRWLAAPVALPVGVVAGLADAVVVHPSTQFDDAWGDTVEFLWEGDDQSAFRRVVMAPLRAAATPVVYALVWTSRAVFDISDRRQD